MPSPGPRRRASGYRRGTEVGAWTYQTRAVLCAQKREGAAYDGAKVDVGKPLDTSVDAAIVFLAAQARDARLAICGGAGISIPAGVPGGPELARRLHERFQRVTGYTCDDPDDLLAVADAASSLSEGLAAVQRVVLELAPFADADPQLAHRLLALLLAEGAVRVLLTNWDDCVERSWRQFEHIPAARNDVEAENLRDQFVLKIHGCRTQPNTLLITSEQLRDAPLWTKIYFEAELARSTMVFVGIGDVADYAQQRITQLANLVEHARIRVVAPDIESGWEGSAWESLLSDLPGERRIEKTADDFLDELAREWVMRLVEDVQSAETEEPAPWLGVVARAFVRFTAVQALAWLRRGAVGWKVGQSVVRAPAAVSALEAIGLLAASSGGAGADEEVAPVQFLPSSAVLVGDERLDVLLCPERQSPSEIQAAAVERARRVAQRLGPQDTLHVLVAASSVRGPKPRSLQAVNVVDPEAPVDDLVGGERETAVRLTYVDEVLEAA
jgi:hypothetical protein